MSAPDPVSDHPLALRVLWIHTPKALTERGSEVCQSHPWLCVCELAGGGTEGFWFESLRDIARYVADMEPLEVVPVCGEGEDACMILDAVTSGAMH